MAAPKSWWQSRTIWVGVLEVIAGVATLLVELPIDSDVSATAIIAGILTIILRVITKRPIGR